MPKFVTDGPDIPEHLLQAHEDGRVVFFCGAGISTPAGLPPFQGLVDGIYQQLGAEKSCVESEAYEKEQYDATIHQLERRYPGARPKIRQTLAKILTPEWRRKGILTTHQALLQLARDRKGECRIVTTNFDRIFQRVLAKEKLAISSFVAPRLPIPKPSRWNGIVYLHGLLPAQPDETALNDLVLSSGDFGLAYLTERWASRFVSALLQNYIVCFVGYGVNDPVLRYMMDALAVDELLGEKKSEAYAFASYTDGQEGTILTEWEAKGVIPVPYKIPTDSQDHSPLHRTLKEWADTYRDGVRGKKMIVAQHAGMPPLTSSRSEFAVGRVLWALTDELAAKHFADLNPVPSLEWLGPLSENQFHHQDLSRFGVVANNIEDNKLRFSILFRPAPYTNSRWMCTVDGGAHRSDWDAVMNHLARWLTRHLDDPKLIIWLVERGGELHELFARLIRIRIKELDAKRPEDLDRIRENAPKAFPGHWMRTLWRLLLAGRIRSPMHRSRIYETHWFDRIARDGITPSLRMELRESLAPCLTLREPFRWEENTPDSSEPTRIRDLVEWELVLSSDNVHEALLTRAARREGWQERLPDLLPDFTILLRDALDLVWELGEANKKSDRSYIHQPSISEHEQNRNFRDWTALIKLTRDAWLATARIDHVQARHAAEGWWQIGYPVFKRLTLFAAAQSDVISREQALGWLLAEDGWWLWSPETQRESLRLLVHLAPKLDAAEMARLERAILEGPPREMFLNDLEQDRWIQIVDRDICLRLARVQETGTVLSQASKTKLEALRQQYPRLRLAENERDEFPFWLESSDVADLREFSHTPRRRRDLVQWLKEHDGPANHWRQDDWLDRCRNEFPPTACALYALTNENIWPAGRWREALQGWKEGGFIKRSWRYMGPVLCDAHDDFVQLLARDLGWWLRAVAQTFESQETLFLTFCLRILKMHHPNEDESSDLNMDDLRIQSMTHPVGLATKALLLWWSRSSPEDGQGLPEPFKRVFTELCDPGTKPFRHGRVWLAAHVVSLYRVDRDWTMEHLVPLFDWQNIEIEARSAWAAFLWSPSIYHPLLSAIKRPMLETAQHYENLGSVLDDQYAALLTYVALDRGDTFTTEELAVTTRLLPQSGLVQVAQTLTRVLASAGNQRAEYWQNRVRPFFLGIWPQNSDLVTPTIAEELARLCLAAGEAFPEALDTLRHWLIPVEYPDFLIGRLCEAGFSKSFPTDALTFLDAIVSNEAQWLPEELGQCLQDIKQRDQTLVNDPCFSRLEELIARRGLARRGLE